MNHLKTPETEDGSPISSSELVVPPSELEVIVPGIKDYPPIRVAEYVVMPSGAIVVLTEDDYRGRESLWFDATGRHPKSYLRRRHNK